MGAIAMVELAERAFAGVGGITVPLDGVLRVGPLAGIPPVLRRFGQDPASVLAAVGLDLSLFDDYDNTIPFVTMGQLLHLCAERTGCRCFGLLAAQQSGLSSLGVVGYLMQHSPDVGTALRDLILHMHLHDRGAVPTLSVRDGVAVLGYAIYQRGVVRADQIYDVGVTVAFNVMRSLCGAEWAPTQVLFSHSKPRDTTPFRRFFRAPLLFDADQTALVFPARWLAHPLVGADPGIRRVLEAWIAAVDGEGRSDVVARLRRVLRTLLISGGGTVEQAAALLSMHPRTLNRRLKDRDTSFKALLDETRFEIARQLIEYTRMPIVEIAATLDYADASAFTRAFKRWSGLTPAVWRGRDDSSGRLR
jgi:AraC-like DNA-binding protein